MSLMKHSSGRSQGQTNIQGMIPWTKFKTSQNWSKVLEGVTLGGSNDQNEGTRQALRCQECFLHPGTRRIISLKDMNMSAVPGDSEGQRSLACYSLGLQRADRTVTEPQQNRFYLCAHWTARLGFMLLSVCLQQFNKTYVKKFAVTFLSTPFVSSG